MHTMRETMTVKCLVCGAGPNEPCLTSVLQTTPAWRRDRYNQEREKIEYLEYELVRVISGLRELKPDHAAVVAFDTLLRQAEPEQLELLEVPAFLRKQAE